MPIKLSSFSLINDEDITYIVDYYNSHRQSDSAEIKPCFDKEYKILGFNITDTKMDRDTIIAFSMQTSKQIRFHGKYLVSFNNLRPFTTEDELLLFQAFSFVLGKENVKYYVSYGDALKNSPSYHISFMNSKQSPIQKKSPIQRHIQKSTEPISFRRFLRLTI